MQIFLATARFFFTTILYCILSRIVFLFCWLTFPFLKLYCQRLNDESFGCIGEERTSSMHFRDLLRKDSRSRSSSVYIRNTSSFLVDEKQTEKPNIYALALRKKNGKSVIQLELYTKQELRKNLSQLKQTNHQVGQMLSPQIKVCFT